MVKDKISMAVKGSVGIWLGIIILFLGIILPWITGWNPAQIRVLAVMIFATVLWTSESLEPTLVSLGILVLIPVLNIIPYAEAFNQFGNTVIWRLVGIFIFTAAMKKSGLGRRIAYHILKLAKGNVRIFFFLVIITSFLFTFLVPAIIGRTMLMLTMMVGLLSAFNISAPSNIAKAIFISIPFVSLSVSTTTMVSSSTTIYTVGLFQGMSGYDLSYLKWFLANVPISLITSISIYFILIRLYPPEMDEFPGGAEYMNKCIRELGPLSMDEKKVFIVFIVLLILWVFNLSDKIPAELLAALLLMLPKVGIMSWKEASREVNWGIPILFAAGLTLAYALKKTNVITELTLLIFSSINDLSPIIIAILIFVLTVVVRLGLSNMMTVVATFMPLVLNLGGSLGINPIWIGYVSMLAATITFLPTQSPAGVVTYGYGYYMVREYAKAGIFVALIMLILTILAAYFYWPILGISIY